MADSQYEVEGETVLFTEVLSKLQQCLMFWMISKAEVRSPVGSGV